MKMISYLKNNGIKRAFEVVYRYKLQKIYNNIFLLFLKNKDLKDIIMIESHNDFDSNGGAFYQYLIDNSFNDKYKIVWQIKNPLKHSLPKNVTVVPIRKPSLRRAYYLCLAKILTYDCTVIPKLRKNQRQFYFSHGPIGLKNCKNMVYLPDNIDYILSPSEFYAPISADQYNLEYPNKKFVIMGYPVHDMLYKKSSDTIGKFTTEKYDKYILWMPTFRKGGGFRRNDSTSEQPLGIPIIETEEQLTKLDNYLCDKNMLLIIKIHPMQDKETIKVHECSNIKVLTGDTVKKLGIDNYCLMRETDALISDYSSAAYDYLHTDRPIAYTLDDENNYKLGFVVDDPKTLMAGHEIYNFDDMLAFINDIGENKDPYKLKRHELFNKLFKYHDDKSCERIVKFMNL